MDREDLEQELEDNGILFARGVGDETMREAVRSHRKKQTSGAMTVPATFEFFDLEGSGFLDRNTRFRTIRSQAICRGVVPSAGATLTIELSQPMSASIASAIRSTS